MGVNHKGSTTSTCRYEEKPKEPADTTLIVAKWLVPTAGVLFGLVGYVIDSAQRSLLAFPTDNARLDDGGRVQDAADFLRFFFTLVGDRLLTLGSRTSFSLGGHWLLLACLTALTVAVLLSCVLRKSNASHGRKTAIVLLAASLPWWVVALITVKFVYFDAPVMRLEAVIVERGVAEEAVRRAADRPLAASSASAATPGAAVTAPLKTRLVPTTLGPVGTTVSDRAFQLWRLIACSRIGGDTLPPEAVLARSANCTDPVDALPKKKAAAELAGEFDASLWLAALISAGAVGLLARRTAYATALGILGLAYLLTVPYAWGKLLKPVDFSYAVVRAADETFQVAGPRGGLPLNVKSTYAFVLGRDSSAVTLLQGVEEPCHPTSGRVLRFSSVPASRIVAIEQIFRLDVIEWALRTQSDCPITEDRPTP
ncbi:hypothetical protein ACNI65_17095 [Roseateles sp. So40a]|uniref:hypothetical protein n=1 Tax=Roseateles sp. So40a TaxID=3400226 RepID=UPI003A899762